LWHSGADGFDQDRGGMLRRILNDFNELLRLVHGVVVGVDDLNGSAESRSHVGHGDCLFCLVIVLSCGKSNNYIPFFHGPRRGVPLGAGLFHRL
jgi:hypothetical protein